MDRFIIYFFQKPIIKKRFNPSERCHLTVFNPGFQIRKINSKTCVSLRHNLT